MKHLPHTLPRLCALLLTDNMQVNSRHVTTNADQSCEENKQSVGTKARACQGSPPCRDRVKLSPEGAVGVSQAKSRKKANPSREGEPRRPWALRWGVGGELLLSVKVASGG